ncbi:type II toxin-antitoxin system PemK/MazF family toxin [Natronoflexus pectinivorans]|uniref:mRNA interferase n=1 Tax=Natronoflexus pectinivorans TaxID=682526 RepID=A0A4R2G7E8_9BACT|nr:type II toxin-antitoxin system PemK/MazF family toxin [Natronoflexus pectinivorans]TCO03656.1 mRNA interferase MazF [Natronoflexus pectinivorans]
MELKQYSIVLVNLDPTVGSEIQKTRPCVIISPDEMNRYLHTIIVAPMTTSEKPYPTRVAVVYYNVSGQIVVDQIRTVDRQRIIRVLGHLQRKEVLLLKSVIKETLVD